MPACARCGSGPSSCSGLSNHLGCMAYCASPGPPCRCGPHLEGREEVDDVGVVEGGVQPDLPEDLEAVELAQVVEVVHLEGDDLAAVVARRLRGEGRGRRQVRRAAGT